MLIVPIWRLMVFVVVNDVPVGRLKYLHGDDVLLLLGDLVVLIGVLTHHPVQAAVGHLGVAGAGEVHGEHLGETISNQAGQKIKIKERDWTISDDDCNVMASLNKLHFHQ